MIEGIVLLAFAGVLLLVLGLGAGIEEAITRYHEKRRRPVKEGKYRGRVVRSKEAEPGKIHLVWGLEDDDGE